MEQIQSEIQAGFDYSDRNLKKMEIIRIIYAAI